MSILDYRTNQHKRPDGKAKVWFCAHPDDFEKYFEPVKDEILAKQDCAVWFDKEPAAAYDENFFADLSQMQLFVMPVTRKLLTTENRALDVEFAFAMEKHIPVLPLMQESGLEQLFNQKCGDLQFLDKHVVDATTISYDEKLEKYLDSVIIGNELAEKIRKAFDAYVFLSYRKKDRKYAQELMRLIHKNDFCRDIAIWYDEFLTPGEDFNKNITEALEKSAFFALAVTPNLLEEPNGKPNYVMEHEFPDACKAGKKILPTELVPTDREELKKKYINIPEITDAYDAPMLSDALKKALDGVAVRENDTDREHNFFIGLAYLGGIDVERDNERALALIQSAAEAKLPEAVKKLVDMYRNGDGVARDYEKAVEWQRELVAIRKTAYEADSSIDNGGRYIDAMRGLGEYLKELHRFEEAVTELENVASLGKVIDEKNDAAKNSIEAADDADTEDAIQDKLKTVTYLNLKNKIYLNSYIKYAFNSYKIKSNRLLSLNCLGDIYRQLGAYKKAAACYEEALGVFEAWETSATSSGMSLRYKSFTYDNLGEMCRQSGDIEKAKYYFQKSQDILSKEPIEDASLFLMLSYIDLGEIAKAENDYEKAQEYYTKAMETAQEYGDEDTLSITYSYLGDISLHFGKYEKAEDFYLKALKIAEEKAKKYDTIDSRNNLAGKYKNLSRIYEKMGNEAESEKFFAKYTEIIEPLAEETNDHLIRTELSSYYGDVGNKALKKADYKKAELYWGKSIKILEDIVANDENTIMRQILIKRYSMMAELKQLQTKGNIIDAHKIYRENIKLYRGIAESTDDPEAWRHLLEDYTSLGGLCEEKGSLLEAQGYYEKRLDAAKRLADKDPNVKTKRDLAHSYKLLGNIHGKLGNKYESQEFYTNELALRSEISEETGSAEDRAAFAEVFMNLGKTYGFLKRKKYLKISLDMFTTLAAEYPDDKNFSKLLADVKKEIKRK